MKIISRKYLAGIVAGLGFLAAGSASQFAIAGIEAGMDVGIDRQGGDIVNFIVADGDPAACRQACERDNRCVAWTFVKPGIQGPQAMCWLKSEVRPFMANGCCISGLKNGAVVAGGPPPMPGFPGVPAAATGTFQAVWAAPGPDVVAPGGNARPDGAADGIFRLDFQGERRTIKSIDLIVVNAQNERGGSHWSTSNGGYWVIVVRSNAGSLNPNGFVPSLNAPPQQLTIFAANNGSFTPGQRFEIEVTFTDGSIAKAYAPAGNI